MENVSVQTHFGEAFELLKAYTDGCAKYRLSPLRQIVDILDTLAQGGDPLAQLSLNDYVLSPRHCEVLLPLIVSRTNPNLNILDLSSCNLTDEVVFACSMDLHPRCFQCADLLVPAFARSCISALNLCPHSPNSFVLLLIPAPRCLLTSVQRTMHSATRPWSHCRLS